MTLRPMKEGSLQLLFESPDLLAQGRLGDMELRSRPPEMQLFGDRQEVAEVAELHARTHIINVSTLPGKCIGHPGRPGWIVVQQGKLELEAGRGEVYSSPIRSDVRSDEGGLYASRFRADHDSHSPDRVDSSQLGPGPGC